MKTTTPEALAILDLFISGYVDGQIPVSDQIAIQKARAAFAAEHEALKWATEHLVLLYSPEQDKDAMVDACVAALAAVEKLP